MAKRRKKCYSGIGGQAVLEGIMMKNQEKYAVAVRKANGEIAVELENYQGLLHGSKLKKIPFIRGVFNFIDSLVLGMKCLNFSASVYDERDEENGLKEGKAAGGSEKLANMLVTVFSVALAVGIFCWDGDACRSDITWFNSNAMQYNGRGSNAAQAMGDTVYS